jgi:hypothetical protein
MSARVCACVQFAVCMPWRYMGEWTSWTSFLNTAIYLDELSGSRPGRFNSGERSSCSFWMGDLWAPESVWVFGLPHAGIQTPDHPTYSLVTILTTPFRLYRLRCDTCEYMQFLSREISFKAKNNSSLRSKCYILICLTVVTYFVWLYGV